MRARLLIVACAAGLAAAAALPPVPGPAAADPDPVVAPAPSTAPAGTEEAASPLTAPRVVQYQGRFTDASGNALAGPVKLTFRLYNAAAGGALLWTETHDGVVLTDGVASVLLGSLVTFPSSAFGSESRYLGISVNDASELLPRLLIASAPFALEAERLQGKSPADFEPQGAVAGLAVDDTSPPNTGKNAVHWNNLTGVPAGFADGNDAGVTDHGELGGLLDDDHPQYAQKLDLSTSTGQGPNTGKNLVSWYNLTDVPSGFADSTDNTGDGVSDHGHLTGLLDNDHPQYLLDTEFQTHLLDPDPHPVYATDEDLSQHAGDPSAHHAKTVDAGELSVGTLDPGRLGAGTVTGEKLADSTLTSAKRADDAGVAEASDPATRVLSEDPHTLISRTLTVPAAGWVLVTATAQGCIVSPSSGGEHPLQFSVSDRDTMLDALSTVQYRVFGLSNIRQCAPLATQKVYEVTPGVHTFYAVGQGEAGTQMEVSGLNLTVVYLPRGY